MSSCDALWRTNKQEWSRLIGFGRGSFQDWVNLAAVEHYSIIYFAKINLNKNIMSIKLADMTEFLRKERYERYLVHAWS